MFIEEYESDFDEAAEAEYEHAMAEYYCKPVTVTCDYCKLTQTATEAQLREIGWELDRGAACFQACCIRDRNEATYREMSRVLDRKQSEAIEFLAKYAEAI